MTEPDHDVHLLLRVKEDYDNVEPCASSVAALNCLRLAQMMNREDFRLAADKTLKCFAGQMERMPRALPQMLTALSFALGKTRQIVISGTSGASDTRALLGEIYSRYIPSKILLSLDGGESQKNLEKLAPLREGDVPDRRQGRRLRMRELRLPPSR